MFVYLQIPNPAGPLFSIQPKPSTDCPPPKVPSFLISEAYIVKTGRMEHTSSIRPVRGDDCGGCAAIIENYSRREPSEITTS